MDAVGAQNADDDSPDCAHHVPAVRKRSWHCQDARPKAALQQVQQGFRVPEKGMSLEKPVCH